MALPEVKITVTDPNLGIVPQALDGITAAVGVCSKFTAGTVYSFGDKQKVRDTLGFGPLAEHVAHILEVAGGPVHCVPVTGTAGAVGVITRVGTGPAIEDNDSDPSDAYKAIVKIVKGGAIGVASFRLSLDGGNTYSAEAIVKAAYADADTGLKLTFPTGTYVAGDTYSFSTTAPTFDSTALGTALEALMTDPREWRFVTVVGGAATAAEAAALAATLKLKLDAAATNYRYVRGFMAVPGTDAEIIAAFAAVESGRIVACPGLADVVSSITAQKHERSALLPIAARAARVPIHEDLGRVASGSLPGVGKLNRDERSTPGLDGQRFSTLRTFIGLPGAYITAGRTLASQISDYQLIQHGFVIDAACRATRTALLRYLNDDVRIDRETGHILEVDAQAIETEVQGQIEAAILAPGHASAVEVKVARDENMISTQTLRCTIAVVPLGYARSIEAEVGLKNPALSPVN